MPVSYKSSLIWFCLTSYCSLFFFFFIYFLTHFFVLLPPVFQVASNKTAMADQVATRGGQMKVQYLYEDFNINRKINAITSAATQNSGTTGHTPNKPAPGALLAKECSVDR